MQTYKVKVKLGSIGDMEAEWMSKEDWEEYKEYVEKLKKEGKEEIQLTVTLVPMPEIDYTISNKESLQTVEFTVLDYTNDK